MAAVLYGTASGRYYGRERRGVHVGAIIDLEELPVTDSVEFLRPDQLSDAVRPDRAAIADVSALLRATARSIAECR